MKYFSFIAVLIFLFFRGYSQGVLSVDSDNPQHIYYQMIHTDSVYAQNFEAIKSYGNTRSIAKSLEIAGVLIVGSAVFFASMDDIEVGSPIYNIMVFGGVGLTLTGWITDLVAISKLKEITNPNTTSVGSTGKRGRVYLFEKR